MRITNKARSSSCNYVTSAVHIAMAASMCVAGATGASAADATPAAPAAETAAPAEVVGEVVVTAERREESLSKVPVSVTAMTQADIDAKGIKDIGDVARFTPGLFVDNSGTNNISIRGISSSGGAGTTGIYIDDTPIQIRALAFNPDEALPKAFDIDRIEVLRGPQGTLFGSGSEGGTVRYITTQPSLTKTTVYSRNELSYTQGGDPSFETGVAVGGPLVEGTLGARATVWYRRDGGWIDRVNPTADDPQNSTVERNANHADNVLLRLAVLWAPNDTWKITPSIYFENRHIADVSNFWPVYSNPGDNHFVSGNATPRQTPDQFYLPSLKVQGDLGPVLLISNTSYYHRNEQTGYDGTEYNTGFYQTFMSFAPFAPGVNFPLIDGTGYHFPAAIANYRSPASIDNDQQNFTQEVRLQSNDPAARLLWTAGLFFSSNRQQYLEQIHDPNLNDFTNAVFGTDYTNIFTDTSGNPITYDPNYPNDSYFLNTHSRDKQYAVFGEATYAIIDSLKLTLGVRESRSEFQFNTLTGGPQLFLANQTSAVGNKENSFTPKVNLAWQIDPNDMVYATWAKGFRPGGGNNPVPYAACAQDFQNFGISNSPSTYRSDTVSSFEVGAKNNIDNRVRIASSLYYIRWHNIQQSVVPPICQISFISNLGEAIAKGVDVQAEAAVTDSLSVELSAGYTDARYTKSSTFSPTQTSAPIVIRGDAIVGEADQPNPPATASVGAQYKFTVFEQESFVRIDYEYTAHSKWLPPRQDPNSSQYDPANFTLPSTSFVSMRAGTSINGWTFEPFVDNLFNTHVLTNYDFSIDPLPATGIAASRLERGYTFRPRTVGLTATYRY